MLQRSVFRTLQNVYDECIGKNKYLILSFNNIRKNATFIDGSESIKCIFNLKVDEMWLLQCVLLLSSVRETNGWCILSLNIFTCINKT